MLLETGCSGVEISVLNQSGFDVPPRRDLKLSIIIPAYNERETLPRILRAVSLVLPGIAREIVLVDDCSRDGTREWIEGAFPCASNTVAAVRRTSCGKIEFLSHADVAAAPAHDFDNVAGAISICPILQATN